MVERSICIREVKGSMPFFSTLFRFAPVRTSDYIRMEYEHMVQRYRPICLFATAGGRGWIVMPVEPTLSWNNTGSLLLLYTY